MMTQLDVKTTMNDVSVKKSDANAIIVIIMVLIFIKCLNY